MTFPIPPAPIPITITITVDPAEAIRTRHASAGPHVLRLTVEDLATLTDDQRDALARHVGGQRNWARPLTEFAPPVGHATVGVLAQLLDLRRAHALAQEQAEQEAADERAKLDQAAASRRAAANAWAETLRAAPLPMLELTEIPEEHRPTFPSLHDVVRHLGREQERRDAHREKLDRAEAEQRQRMASALRSAGFLELSLLFERGESRKSEVTRALRRWVRCVVGCVGVPSSWKQSNGEPDSEGTAVATARAVDAWTRSLTDRGVVWPDGFGLLVGPSYAWRPAMPDEEGDEDGEIQVPAVAFLLTCPDGRTIAVCTGVDDRPLGTPSNQQRVETQQRIAKAVREATPSHVAGCLAVILGTDPVPENVSAILAASLDPAIVDALKQVAQARAFEE